MSRDVLTVDSIKQGLSTRWIGKTIFVYSELASTNITAKELALDGTANGTVVIAEFQTAGHGRLGRQWLSPTGNLAVSIVLYPDKTHLPRLIMVSALAVADTIEAITGKKAGIKWPNDVQVRGKKISGILIENGLQGDTDCYAVIGIGLNVNVNVAVYPELAAIATSIADELGSEVPCSRVARELLQHFEHRYSTLLAGEPIFENWRERLTTLGQPVCVTAGGRACEGVAIGVTADGSLLVRQSGGEVLTFPVGDVSLRRA